MYNAVHSIVQSRERLCYLLISSPFSRKQYIQKNITNVGCYVTLSVLEQNLKDVCGYVFENKDFFIQQVKDSLNTKQGIDIAKQNKDIPKHNKRLKEIDILINKIYEDNVLGKLSDERYETLNVQYAQEHYLLKEKIKNTQAYIQEHDTANKNTNRFVELVERYEKFTDLSQTMINEFVHKIVIHERPIKGTRSVPRRIDIYYNHIGQISIEKQLTQEEIEELEKEQTRLAKRREASKRWRDKNKEKTKEHNQKSAERRKGMIYDQRKALDREPELKALDKEPEFLDKTG